MKSFEIIRKNMAAVGIDVHQSEQKFPFTAKNVAALSIMTIGMSSSILYTIFVAESFEMYVDTTYATSALFACGFVFTNVILNTLKINLFLSDLESTVSESKKKLYMLFNRLSWHFSF